MDLLALILIGIVGYFVYTHWDVIKTYIGK